MHHGSDYRFVLYEKFKNMLCDFIGTRGATLGYNLSIILETIIFYFHTIHLQSERLKDVTMNCDYYERISFIRITLLFISTVLIITFSLVSVQLFKDTLIVLKFSPISVFLLIFTKNGFYIEIKD